MYEDNFGLWQWHSVVVASATKCFILGCNYYGCIGGDLLALQAQAQRNSIP